MWFATNMLYRKIKKAQSKDGSAHQNEVIRIIRDEYSRCKSHYKKLKSLEPKPESAL